MLEDVVPRFAGRVARTAARGSTRLWGWQVDREKNAGAGQAYRAIVAQAPERALSPATEKLVAAYARDVLGSTVFAPWLRVFTAFRGSFHEGWLPPNFLQRVVRPHLDRQRDLSDAKTLSGRVLLASPLLPDRVARVRGSWLDRDGTPITQAEARAIVFAEADRAFLKRDGIQRGAGVMPVDRAGFDAVVAAIPDDFVVQELIRQHPLFDTWNASNLATMRLVTFKPAGAAAELRAGYLRIGRAADAAVLSHRALRVAIDVRAGRMLAGATLPDWRQTDRHPDSGAAFTGGPLPQFGRIAAALCQLHDRLPHVALIGWDAILDASDRVVVLEWGSGSGGERFPEATTGPNFPELARRDWRAALAEQARARPTAPGLPPLPDAPRLTPAA